MSYRSAPVKTLSVTMLVIAAMCGPAWAQPARPDQLKPDEAAVMQLLNAGRAAFNERRYDIAAQQFREFLRQYGSHREAAWAQFGLGLSLMELPQKDFKSAAETLAATAADQKFPQQPIASYYRAVALRALGQAALNDATARPAEAVNLRNIARQKFTEAEQAFASAGTLFESRIKSARPSTQPDAIAHAKAEADYLARARLDQAEMLLRLDRPKDALPIATALLTAAPAAHQPTARYLAGYAQFALGDYLAAGKLLSKLVPFDQEFGPHARYLLARSHHLSGEAPEATIQYAGVIDGYKSARTAAQQRLGNPAALSPAQRDFAQSLVNGPPPDYVVRATFYLGVLHCEAGAFADGLAKFTDITQNWPKCSQAAETQARAGYCMLRTRDFPKAVATLTPLAENPDVGDLACWWLARTHIASADPNNKPALEQATRAAIDLFQKAAAKSAQRAAIPPAQGGPDPDAKVRRADILMDLADTQQSIGLHKEAAATYQLVLTENAAADRVEEATQRQVTALHLAGQYRESDALAAKFIAGYPKSLLLPAVMFRSAENAYMLAESQRVAPNANAAAVSAAFTEAAGRYERLLKQFPDFAHVHMARQGLAACQYQLGKLADAAATLAAIPDAERTGELALASYVQADCLIRTLPPEGEDALQAARVLEKLDIACKLLESFVAAQPQSPQLPDAMLKLGHCHARTGSLLADVQERNARLTRAREVFEKIAQQFPQSPAVGPATLERAKVHAMMNDQANAIRLLPRLQNGPLRLTPAAPLGALRQIALLRATGRAQEAAAFAAQARSWHEAVLLKDPARVEIAAAIQYEHAVALCEANKPAEARPILEGMIKQFPTSVHEANARWRLAQVRREELSASIAAARTVLMRPGLRPEQAGPAVKSLADAQSAMQQLAGSLAARADEQAKSAAGSEPHLRMLYEAAWCMRIVADAELELAAHKVRQDRLAAVLARIGKQLPPGQAPPGLRPPDVPVADLPVQPSEQPTRQLYEKLIAAKPTAELANLARYELADLLARRNDLPKAGELLADIMENNPSPPLADQVRLRLAALLLARGPDKHAAALAQAQRVAKQPQEPLYAPARLIEAEIRFAQKDWAKVVELLVPFRDQGPLTNRPNISDRALLRLGQAYAEQKQFDASRQAYQILVQRFPASEFVEDAFFGIGWTLQQQKQFDAAVGSFAEVTRRTPAEVAARAQLHAGLCRLEQTRWADAARDLLLAALVYDYPDVAAQARYEAATAYLQLKQPADAIRLYQQIVAEHPNTQWCELAKKKLGEVKP